MDNLQNILCLRQILKYKRQGYRRHGHRQNKFWWQWATLVFFWLCSILCVHVSIFSGVNKELYGIVACNVDGRGLPLFLHMKLCDSTFLSGLIHKVRNIKCVWSMTWSFYLVTTIEYGWFIVRKYILSWTSCSWD